MRSYGRWLRQERGWCSACRAVVPTWTWSGRSRGWPALCPGPRRDRRGDHGRHLRRPHRHARGRGRHPGPGAGQHGQRHRACGSRPAARGGDRRYCPSDASRVSHQRIDQAGLGRSVAKAAITVGGPRPGEAAARIVRMALAPPPGPVIASMDASAPGLADPDGTGPDSAVDDNGTQAASAASFLAGALRAARRPVLLLGTGAIPRTASVRRPWMAGASRRCTPTGPAASSPTPGPTRPG